MQAKAREFLVVRFSSFDGNPVLTHWVQRIIFVKDFAGLGCVGGFQPESSLGIAFGRSIVATKSHVEAPDVHPVILLAHPEIQICRPQHEMAIEELQALARSNASWTGDPIDSCQELPVQTIGLILGNFGQHAPFGNDGPDKDPEQTRSRTKNQRLGKLRQLSRTSLARA